MRGHRFIALLALVCWIVNLNAAEPRPAKPDGNHLAYLDTLDLYYPHRDFPKLTTPQWVGEPGVEAVVILGIDDMRDSKKYEAYLRPILNRLKQIDGRAPVSIMTCSCDPDDPQLQAWLKEGLSLETHTFDHPCPLLQKGDFAKAKATYDKCVDLLAGVPHSKPVAFRVPCCDSLNTPSPRFFAHIFNERTAKGNFLSIDTSVFNIFTAADPALPRELVLDANGTEKFRKYIPAERSFVNTIEDYPYPYVIGKLCWEFPCVNPSDWQAQYLHKPNNPITVKDWQAALDCTVIKQGVFCLVFHPHNWIKPEQVVDLIDHAVAKHGKKVKFLTFKEAQERLDRTFTPLRDAKTGQDNGVRLLDMNGDGYLDAIREKKTQLWSPIRQSWDAGEFPVSLKEHPGQFGIIGGHPVFLALDEKVQGGWQFDQGLWRPEKKLLAFEILTSPPRTHQDGKDQGLRLLDMNGDGNCQLLYQAREPGYLIWSAESKAWALPPWRFPVALVTPEGEDNGVRLFDCDADGDLDIVWSNERGYGLYRNAGPATSFKKAIEGKPGDAGALPLITAKGKNMGAFFHSKHIWWQNENTSHLPNLVDRRSFAQLLGGPAAKEDRPRPK